MNACVAFMREKKNNEREQGVSRRSAILLSLYEAIFRTHNTFISTHVPAHTHMPNWYMHPAKFIRAPTYILLRIIEILSSTFLSHSPPSIQPSIFSLYFLPSSPHHPFGAQTHTHTLLAVVHTHTHTPLTYCHVCAPKAPKHTYIFLYYCCCCCCCCSTFVFSHFPRSDGPPRAICSRIRMYCILRFDLVFSLFHRYYTIYI